jgi:hypothetical protein
MRVSHRDRDAERGGHAQCLGQARCRFAALELPDESATDAGGKGEILKPQAAGDPCGPESSAELRGCCN